MINTAKQRMLRGEPAFGYSLGLGSPLAAEALSRSGIDFLLLETQHGSWGGDSAIAAIMAVEGIDGCWAGPADLALSMGIHPRDAGQDERHARALERIVQACRNTGKIPGLACGTPEEAQRRASEGFQFLTAGSDA